MSPTERAPLLQAQPRAEWSGRWIWPEAVRSGRNVYALFRRTFRAEKPSRLEVHITADSVYSLHLDGAFVARGPARAPLACYSFDSFTFDVDPGLHCIAVLAHHVGETNATMMLGRPGLLADVSVEGAGDLSTGPAWRAIRSDAWREDLPEMMSHFGFWEELDLRRLPARWTEAAFDDRNWPAAVEVGRPGCQPWTRLIGRDIPPLRHEKLAPAAIVAVGRWTDGAAGEPMPSRQAAARRRELQRTDAALPLPLDGDNGRGRYVTIDFGRTVSGTVVLDFSQAAAGQCVDVSFDEALAARGAVDPERTYAHMTDRYIMAGGPATIRSTHPRGFRYVTVDVGPGGQAAIQQAGAVEETYPFVRQPAFRSSDRDLSAFVAASAETVRICTTDTFTDCPTRERVQWAEDLFLHAQVAAYAFADTALTRRTLFQAAQCQLPDGRINGFFPSERDNCAFASSSILWLHLLAEYWLHTGADEDVRRLLPTAGRLLRFLGECEDEAGLIARWPTAQFWEWAPIENQGCLLLTNAACGWALSRLAEHAIFRDGLGEQLEAGAQRIRAAAGARFWDAQRGLYRDAILPDGTPSAVFSQDANAMACLAGVCPPERRADVLRRIIDPAELGPVPEGECGISDETRADGRIVQTGTLWFGYWLCRALFEAGLDRQAVRQMRALWGEFDGAPTYPELRRPGPNASYCHGWSAGPAVLCPAYVMGIQSTGPGWSRVAFRPHPGDVADAAGTFQTPRGDLHAAWRREGGMYELSLDLPAGVTAEVRFGRLDETVTGPARWQRPVAAPEQIEGEPA